MKTQCVNKLLCYYGNILSNRIQLTDLLTVLCDRVGVMLLGQLYQLIVNQWIKVHDIADFSSNITMVTGRG